MMVDTASALQRCTEWVHGFEKGILRRRFPKAHAWSKVAVSMVVTTEGDRFSACIAVDVMNERTGKIICTMPHSSGWQSTCAEAMRELVRDVAHEALRFGVDIFSGLEDLSPEQPIATGTTKHPIYPVTLFGVRQAAGES